MKALVLQNSSNSGLGVFQDIMVGKYGFAIDTVDPRKVAIEDISYADHDLVVTLGSGRGVYEAEYGWINAEKEFTRRLLDEGKPLIGICFGGQLIAAAMGSVVRPMDGRKIKGWIENDEAVDAVWRGPWFRWHGDMFDFPEDVIRLASHDSIPQAFQTGNAVATQFHPEVDEKIITAWVAETASGKYPLDLEPDRFLPLALDELGRARERTEALLDDMLERTLGVRKTKKRTGE